MKNNISFTRSTTLLITILISNPGMAAVCNNVLFYANNTKGIDIRIDKVQYRDQNSGNSSATFTESIPDFTCVQHSSCVASVPQNLGSSFVPRENHNPKKSI
jgi:hypothetical protein